MEPFKTLFTKYIQTWEMFVTKAKGKQYMIIYKRFTVIGEKVPLNGKITWLITLKCSY